MANDALIKALREEDDESQNLKVLPPPMKDSGEPQYEVQNEKPWHRTLAYLLLQGKSAVDAAKTLNKTPVHIREVRKQAWFKELLAELASIHFDNDVAGLLEGAALEAITTLSELATTAKSESVKRAAASDLLDKYLRNKVTPVKETPDDPKAEMDQIDQEIKALEEKK